MAFRIHDSVVRGELDNTRRGVVTGKIWLTGRERPLVLELAGDCWRDLAGRRLTFINPNPKDDQDCGLAEKQTGEVGDITASRKVRVPDLPIEEWYMRKKSGLDAPEHWGNALYLEWYGDYNGRVVIESADYNLKVSLPEWEVTEDEEQRQREINNEAMQRFMNRLEAALRPEKPVNVPDDRDMDEHEWERFLKQCDARTERFGELLDKFRDDPKRDRIVAKHMGWDHLLESMDADDAGEFGNQSMHDREIINEGVDDWLDSKLDPETEGIDWIRTDHGDICHPLQYRCFELGIRMFHDAQELGLVGPDVENPDESVDLMNFKTHCASRKLAGALNGLARDIPVESGFIVAYLKRALGFINDSLGAMKTVEDEGKMPDHVSDYRLEMFEIRSTVIDLMQRYREDH
jgi:hypothetical protein